MSLKIFDKTQLAELTATDLNVPLVFGDTTLDTEGLYLTGIQGAHKPTVQMLSAADSSVWLNTFSQRPSPVTLSGVIVPTACTDSTAGASANVKKGLLKAYNTYRINKATKPLQITYNGIVMSGYFLDLNFSSARDIPKAMAFTIVYLCIVESALDANELTETEFI